MTFFAADGSGRHVPSYNQPPSFPSTQPVRRKPPLKAVDVFPQTITHIKIQGFPASQLPKSTFSAGGKSPESPVFKPFFRRLFVFYICHQYHALHMHRMREHVDRLGFHRPIPLRSQIFQIPCQGCGVAGYVYHPPRLH